MKTQTEVKLPEPHRMDDGGWEFPEGWSDEDKRDWLVTHPEPVEAGTPAGYTMDDVVKDGDPQANGQETLDLDLGESNDTQSEQKPVALGMVVPPGKEDEITADNYSPSDFLLVHVDVWQEFLNGLCDGDDALVALKDLQKLHRAHMRGMKKVNKHWSDTKREFAKERLQHTRTARKLRKARAGRDRWQRRTAQLEQSLRQERLVTQGQELYIRSLENRLRG